MAEKMTFDEWLDNELQFWGEHGLMSQSQHTKLLKLVRAQDKIIEKLLMKLTEEPGSVIVLGPNSRKLMDEIEDLEAALIGRE